MSYLEVQLYWFIYIQFKDTLSFECWIRMIWKEVVLFRRSWVQFFAPKLG